MWYELLGFVVRKTRFNSKIIQMNKYCVLSTDNNPDYYRLLPLACHSWRKIGYEPVIIFVNVPDEIMHTILDACPAAYRTVLGPHEGTKDSTIAQVQRLFEWMKMAPDDIMITSDADMVIAKDIFNCNDGFTNYGFDLTGRSELPICYNIATAAKWRELMGEFHIPEKAYSERWEDYWSVDQQLLTQRAREYGMEKITFVDRGNNGYRGLPTGRWDRFAFEQVPAEIIDVHMPRNSWEAQIQVAERLWPGEDHSFITKFREALNG